MGRVTGGGGRGRRRARRFGGGAGWGRCGGRTCRPNGGQTAVKTAVKRRSNGDRGVRPSSGQTAVKTAVQLRSNGGQTAAQLAVKRRSKTAARRGSGSTRTDGPKPNRRSISGRVAVNQLSISGQSAAELSGQSAVKRRSICGQLAVKRHGSGQTRTMPAEGRRPVTLDSPAVKLAGPLAQWRSNRADVRIVVK